MMPMKRQNSNHEFLSASKKKKENNQKCLERKNARAKCVCAMTLSFFLQYCCSGSANHDPCHFPLLLQCVNTTCMGAIQ